MTEGHIGRSLSRLEDRRFLTGQGRYVDDINVPGQLHAIVLRSPHGHAAIEGIDASVARAMPGVHGVFTAADLDADGIGPLPCVARVATVAPMIVPLRRALARDRVRHVGDPVVFVVADTADQACDAAERVRVAYRSLPAVVDARAALAAEAPRLWDEAPGNQSYRFAWDYVYKTIASTWVKTTKDARISRMGMGYHTRGNPELCLLAARGKGVRPADNSAARPPWKNATRSRRYQGSILELPTDMNFRAVGRRPQKESPKWQL